MSATQPGTAAGRALLDRLVKDSIHFNDPDLRRIIGTVEAEAAAAERERIRAGLYEITGPVEYDGERGVKVAGRSQIDAILDASPLLGG